MALGGIGTIGTLICLIIDSNKKAKQIDTVQNVQLHQLELLYEPDIRILSWTNTTSVGKFDTIVISNQGEKLKILDIHTLSDSDILNKKGMKNWFPYEFYEGHEIHIPMSVQLKDINGIYSFGIVCSNKLGSKYIVPIQIEKSKPIAQSPIMIQ